MSKAGRKSGYDVGYGRTPASTRFEKGRSGNPKGRPKGRHNQAPYEAVLGQMVSIQEGGVERRMSAAEAFLLHMAKRGLDGDGAAARSAMAAISEARAARGATAADEIRRIVRIIATPGSVNTALKPLRMAVKLDRYRPTARMMLEPWLVQAALLRLGERLSREEQVKVVRVTRTPRQSEMAGLVGDHALGASIWSRNESNWPVARSCPYLTGGSVQKLTFPFDRTADIAAWARRGEELLDGRKAPFQGSGVH